MPQPWQLTSRAALTHFTTKRHRLSITTSGITAMGSPCCKAYSSHTDLQQSLQKSLDHPDSCLPSLRRTVPSTAQRSAETSAQHLVAVTNIKSFNGPGCLFISRAMEVGDLCTRAAEVGTHFVEPERQSFPTGCTGTMVSCSHSCFPTQLPPHQTGTSPMHQQPAKPARHPQAGNVSPRCCTDGPPGHSPEGDGGSLGWLGLALEHCWCWLGRVFLILSRSSRLGTPLGDLPHGKDFVRDFTKALFGENMLCLTSLKFIWLRRHLLVLLLPFPQYLWPFL